MSAADDSAKLCPRCRAPLDATAYASGAPFTCGRCGAKVQRNPAADATGKATDEPVSSEQSGDLLVDLQNLLQRMLIGVFEYAFVELPCEIVRQIRRWLPTLLRLVFIFVLACLWLCAALGPLAYFLSREGRGTNWIPIPLPTPEFYLRYTVVFDVVIVFWTIIALYGSGRKAVRSVRRARQNRRASTGTR